MHLSQMRSEHMGNQIGIQSLNPWILDPSCFGVTLSMLPYRVSITDVGGGEVCVRLCAYAV